MGKRIGHIGRTHKRAAGIVLSGGPIPGLSSAGDELYRSEMDKKNIVIIGGGFCGTLAAIHLLRVSAQRPLAITIIERRDAVGPGLAYTVPSPRCTLNVPARAMGGYVDDPEGFLRWLRAQGIEVEGGEFVSRQLYGAYLQHLLAEARRGCRDELLTIVRDEALDIAFDDTRKQFQVTCAQTSEMSFDHCVLAVGNLARCEVSGISTDVFCDPYREDTYTDIASKQQLVIVGMGLTAVDCVLEAEARGFRGRYILISRHARLPLVHEQVQGAVIGCAADDLHGLSLRELVRLVRGEATRLGSSQPVIEAIRPHLQGIWQGLSFVDKGRFVRHVRPIWDAHRHRIPAAHAQVIHGLLSQGRLELVAGRLLSASSSDREIQLAVISRGVERRVHGDRGVSAVGPEGDLRKVTMPLIRNLLRRGIIVAGRLGLGIEPGQTSLPSDAQQRFHVVGPLQREALWEITAVRELRVDVETQMQRLGRGEY
jgi:uncharacterized NAD(P)/FAD-binding protein YdhS